MELRYVTGARKAGLVLVLAGSGLLLGGCPKSAPPPSEQESPQVIYLNHTVKYPGETLAAISSWYTGSSRNWAAIVKHNPGLNPKRIHIGNVILIPRALVVKGEPMPEKFVRASAPKAAPTAAPAEGEQPAEAAVVEREPAPEAAEPPSTGAAPSEPTTIVAPTPEAIQALEPTEAPAAPAEPAAAAAATEAPAAAAAAGSAASPAAEAGTRKIKTRDELLRELLEE